jgi:hypothetical protein
MPIDDKYKNFGKSAYDIINGPDPLDDPYTSPIDWTLLSNTSASRVNDERLKKLREKQNLEDKVNKKMVKPYIQRVAKQMDSPRATNPTVLWGVKRTNHKLLQTEKNPNMRAKLTQEILDADKQLLKNLDEETDWLTKEKSKVRNEINESNKQSTKGINYANKPKTRTT